MIAGACRYCGCTEDHACEDGDHGCAWTDDTQTCCSVCQDAEQLVQKVIEIFGRLGPMLTPPAALPSPAWTDLVFDQQQVLVMGHRRIAEANRELLIETITQDAVDAMYGLRAITRFLMEHCPQQLQADEPIDEAVIRILEPHVGSKIVLPGQGARM